MKNLKALLAILALVSANLLIPAAPASAAVCSLSGAGTSSDPWQVGSAADFQKISDSPCLASGYYKQTANITLTTPSSDYSTTTLSGTYDGDFHTITLSGGWSDGTYNTVYGVMGQNVSGTIKKLNLTGDYKTSSYWGQPLILNVKSGGLISQVSSDVNVTVTGNADTIKLSGLVQRLGRGATMEYSRASGNLFWEPTTTTATYQYYGGLVIEMGIDEDALAASDPRKTEMRDSYSAVTIKWPDAQRCRATVGGLVGMQPTVTGDIYLVRSYSASKFATGVDYSGTGCSAIYPAIGGLVGRSDASKYIGSSPNNTIPTFMYSISSFWAKDLIGGSAYSVGYPRSGDTNQYTSSLPRGVGLDSSYLKTLSTFQSKESATTGIPDTNSNLAISSSTGTYSTDGTLNANEATYRWGIEAGDVSTFTPPTYGNVANFLTRTVLTDTSVNPALGRVWEICSTENSGFPVLVWEDKCGAVVASTPSSSASPVNKKALAATGASKFTTNSLAAYAFVLVLFGAVLVKRSNRITKEK